MTIALLLLMEWARITWHKNGHYVPLFIHLFVILALAASVPDRPYVRTVQWLLLAGTVLSFVLHRTPTGTRKILPIKNGDLFHIFSILSAWPCGYFLWAAYGIWCPLAGIAVLYGAGAIWMPNRPLRWGPSQWEWAMPNLYVKWANKRRSRD